MRVCLGTGSILHVNGVANILLDILALLINGFVSRPAI